MNRYKGATDRAVSHARGLFALWGLFLLVKAVIIGTIVLIALARQL